MATTFNLSDGPRTGAIRAAAASLNCGELDRYLQHFASSCVRWVDGIEVPFSLSEVSQNLSQLLSAFGDLHLGEELLFGTDRFVCAHWRLTGRQVGEYVGIPPTGRQIDVPTCEVYEFDAGQVSTTWTHGDMALLFHQIDGAAATARSL